MNSPAYDIAQILDAVSSMPAYGTGIFVSKEPTSPDDTITVFDTGGFEPDIAVDYQRPTVQIRVRDRNYSEAYATIDAIKDILHGSYSNEQGGVLYTGIWAMGDIQSLGEDDNGRVRLVLNFRIHRIPTA